MRDLIYFTRQKIIEHIVDNLEQEKITIGNREVDWPIIEMLNFFEDKVEARTRIMNRIDAMVFDCL